PVLEVYNAHGRVQTMTRQQSVSSLKVLSEMLRHPTDKHYGLALIEATGVKSGSLYPILRRLEDQHLIAGEWEDIDEAAEGRRRRRYYKLTPDGVEFATGEVLRVREQLTGIPVLHPNAGVFG